MRKGYGTKQIKKLHKQEKKQPKTLCLPGSKHFHDRIAVGPSAVCSCYTMHTGRTVAPGTKYKKHFNTGNKQQQQKIGKETFQPSIANMEIANVALTDLTELSFRSGNFIDLKSLRERSSQTEQLLLKVKKILDPQ